MADPKNKGAAARARYAAQSNSRNDFQPAEFINVNLDDAENQDKALFIPDYTVLLNLMAEGIEGGYKFTVKWDERGNCTVCFMQHTDTEHENAGFILTGRGATPGSALRECLYIHHRLLSGNWQSAAAVRGNRNASDDF